MNKKDKITLILIILYSFGVTKAQNNYLEPVSGIYDIYDFQFEYYSKVRKVLFKGLTDSPEIRFQIMPSFTPENVLDIEFDIEKNKYYIVYHICEKMIWYNDELDKIKVYKYKSEINKESVELIKRLFEIAIFQSRFTENDRTGIDGENYYFSIYKYGMKSGTVWSPSEKTNMRKLVDIGLNMIELVKHKDSIVKIENKLQDKIEALINSLKNKNVMLYK
ncbi:MAG: hypothetical protein HRT66_06340 [Flavobacteriaceae bacterium]|nr:hypothetical protein [Flavobacteriaceae bacterium]